MPVTLSAVVVAYNRAAIIGTCLRALAFADEVVVVDKSSTDGSATIATRHADRVITVPWTPTVEETRAFAVTQARGEWILLLDDDECLAPSAGDAIRAELAAPRGDIYALPLRHYILGAHDETAYYWPEHHPRLFRRGAIVFAPTVHGGMQFDPDCVVALPPDSEAVIHHLSHRDVAEWIDKCNRYTSRPDRRRDDDGGRDVAAYAYGRIEHWLAQSHGADPGSYAATVAVLRAVYDIIDRLKTWEEERGVDGATAFAAICADLDACYAQAGGNPLRAGVVSQDVPCLPGMPREAGAEVAAARFAALRGERDAAITAARHWEEEADRFKTTLAAVEETAEARAVALATERRDRAALERRLAAIEGSTCWRATAGARRLAEKARRLSPRLG